MSTKQPAPAGTTADRAEIEFDQERVTLGDVMITGVDSMPSEGWMRVR